MTHFYLSVLRALPASAAPAAHVVTVLRVDGAPSLQWVRRHADEIAQRHSPGYCALMVRDTLPEDEASACHPVPAKAQAIAERDAMLNELRRATTAADLRALYLDWIGLGALDVEGSGEDDTTSDEEARGILADFIREHCYSAGIPCPDFGNTAPKVEPMSDAAFEHYARTWAR